jgi:hypothetical protein
MISTHVYYTTSPEQCSQYQPNQTKASHRFLIILSVSLPRVSAQLPTPPPTSRRDPGYRILYTLQNRQLHVCIPFPPSTDGAVGVSSGVLPGTVVTVRCQRCQQAHSTSDSRLSAARFTTDTCYQTNVLRIPQFDVWTTVTNVFDFPRPSILREFRKHVSVFRRTVHVWEKLKAPEQRCCSQIDF